LGLSGIYGSDGMGKGYTANISAPELSYDQFSVYVSFKPKRFVEPPFVGWKAKLNRWTGNHLTPILGNRRDQYCIIMGGAGYRWLGFYNATNHLQLRLNNNRLSHSFENARVKMGKWNHLLYSYDGKSKTVRVVLNGVRLEDALLAKDFTFEVVGSEFEQKDKQICFEDYSTGNAFAGNIERVAMWNRALGEQEMEPLFHEQKKMSLQSRPWWVWGILAVAGGAGLFLWWRKNRNVVSKLSVNREMRGRYNKIAPHSDR
jgi:hypothetical protein